MPIRPPVLAAAGAVLAATLLTGCTSATSTTSSTPSRTPTTSTSSAASTAPQTRPTSSATTATTASVAPSPDPTPTARVILRPVTAGGDPAPGWTARTQSLTIDCSAGSRSPVTVSDGVLYCAPSAAAAIACWKARTAGDAYCLSSATTRTLVRYPLAGGTFPRTGPSELEPQPLGLALTDGTTCSFRDGGAAGRLAAQPDWVPYYFCGKNDTDAVWADPDSVSSGITSGDGASTVALAPSDGSAAPVATAVRTEYLVGTAAG